MFAEIAPSEHSPARAGRLVVGLALVVGGMATDALAGTQALAGNLLIAILLHVVGVVPWVIGIEMTAQQSSMVRHVGHSIHTEVESPRALLGPWRRLIDRRKGMSSWTVLAGVLGLFLFPGLGPAACGLAFTISWVLRWNRRRRADALEELDVPIAPLRASRAVNALRALEIQPLVDVLHGPDLQAKRAAIDLLCSWPSLGGGLLRSTLADPDPDVRSLAAVALTRLDDRFTRQINEARAAASHEDTEAHVRIAHMHYEYALSDPTDQSKRTFHLSHARDALQRALVRQPERGDLLVELARVYRELTDHERAWQAALAAIGTDPHRAEAYLLGMELAFRTGRLDALRALARQSTVHAGWPTDVLAIARWWADPAPPALAADA
ncbi:MAG: hypothetical protein GEU73_08795 [Chloroflexi bacterium]|nr:hypothetical protein [Chloroflexota bacterium]